MFRRIDVFPAIIYLAEPESLDSYLDLEFSGPKPPKTRKVDRARVTIFDDKLFIVVDSPEGPKLVFRELLTEFSEDKTLKSHHALTESGKIVVFSKDVNCGCGSRLRSWSPLGKNVSSSADPTE
jgi:hypothetical protein